METLDEEDMNVPVVFVSTLISLEMELKQTQQSEIPRREMVSELCPHNATQCQCWDHMRIMRARDG